MFGGGHSSQSHQIGPRILSVLPCRVERYLANERSPAYHFGSWGIRQDLSLSNLFDHPHFDKRSTPDAMHGSL